MVKTKEVPKPLDVAGDTPRIGVFVCPAASTSPAWWM
jgi:hypothetical protein